MVVQTSAVSRELCHIRFDSVCRPSPLPGPDKVLWRGPHGCLQHGWSSAWLVFRAACCLAFTHLTHTGPERGRYEISARRQRQEAQSKTSPSTPDETNKQ